MDGLLTLGVLLLAVRALVAQRVRFARSGAQVPPEPPMRRTPDLHAAEEAVPATPRRRPLPPTSSRGLRPVGASAPGRETFADVIVPRVRAEESVPPPPAEAVAARGRRQRPRLRTDLIAAELIAPPLALRPEGVRL